MDLKGLLESYLDELIEVVPYIPRQLSFTAKSPRLETESQCEAGSFPRLGTWYLPSKTRQLL